DFVCGKPSAVHGMNDQNNGQTNLQTTSYTYDPFCRESEIHYPLGGYKLTFYHKFGDPSAQYIEIRTPFDDTRYVWQNSYLDGLGRIYQERKRGPSDQDIVVDTAYNPRGGTIAKKSLPRYGDPGPRYLTYAYDALDRPIQLTYPGGATVR